MIIKIIILVLLALILISLTSAMFSMLSRKPTERKTAKYLTYRITLSVLLFIFLVIGFLTGAIKPHGLFPTQAEKAEVQETLSK